MASWWNEKNLINSKADEKAIWNEKLMKQKVDEMLSRSNGMKWHINEFGKNLIKSYGDEKESRNEK